MPSAPVRVRAARLNYSSVGSPCQEKIQQLQQEREAGAMREEALKMDLLACRESISRASGLWSKEEHGKQAIIHQLVEIANQHAVVRQVPCTQMNKADAACMQNIVCTYVCMVAQQEHESFAKQQQELEELEDELKLEQTNLKGAAQQQQRREEVLNINDTPKHKTQRETLLALLQVCHRCRDYQNTDLKYETGYSVRDKPRRCFHVARESLSTLSSVCSDRSLKTNKQRRRPSRHSSNA